MSAYIGIAAPFVICGIILLIMGAVKLHKRFGRRTRRRYG